MLNVSLHAQVSDLAWKKSKTILTNIKQTSFKNKTYNILDFGAQPIAKQDNTQAITKAINTCSKNGGGKVIIPKGKFFTGPIHLDNNVNLHLEEGAELAFSTNSKDYPIVQTSFEGTECMNYSPLIYAFQKTNIAVTGKGTLNGQASEDNWWKWVGKDHKSIPGEPSQNDPENRDRLVSIAEENIPVSKRIFGENHYLRPNFVEFFECNTALIEGITITNAPFWIIHPMKSKNITIDGVTVASHGPNNDGCDPEYCENVWIKNCTFNTGDDCIAIKSGRDGDGRRVNMPSKNILIQNCKMIDGHGGVVIGSEISGGVNNVFVENCTMDSPNLDRAIRIKTNSKRGGVIENIFVRNCEVGTVKECVLKLNMFYAIYGDQSGSFIPTIRNIYLENIKVKNGGKYAILANGYEESPIENVGFKNVTIDKVENDFSLKNVKNLQITNTTINGKKIENQ
ncbi:glycoside hydrolase family 28 protein [Flavobacterium agrisoli]|nr:glycoside hydrolase family 28 protein [Flavobacterium agrisoli]